MLKDITSGTVIYFTDFGWEGTNNDFQSGEPCGVFTGALSDGIVRWEATSDMSCGEEVIVYCKTTPSASSGTGTGFQSTFNTATDYMSLTSAGEQIFAYQGSYASPTLLAALNYDDDWNDPVDECDVSSTVSELPAALNSGNTAILFVHFDNGIYNGTINCSDAAATRTSIANASNWTFSNLPLSIVLPVEWLTFTAKSVNETVLLDWTVATQTNNTGFEVQKSVDGRNWQKVAFIKGAGNTQIEQAYHWVDDAPNRAANYYRLKQIDFDGNFSFSDIVTVQLTVDIENSISIFPNPVSNSFTINTNSPVGNATITLYAFDGEIIRVLTPEEVDSKISVEGLAAGLYYVELRTETYQVIEKFVKK